MSFEWSRSQCGQRPVPQASLACLQIKLPVLSLPTLPDESALSWWLSRMCSSLYSFPEPGYKYEFTQLCAHHHLSPQQPEGFPLGTLAKLYWTESLLPSDYIRSFKWERIKNSYPKCLSSVPPPCLENLPFFSSGSPVFYTRVSALLILLLPNALISTTIQRDSGHGAAGMCVLSRPSPCVRVGCLPWGLKVLTKAFLSVAIQTFVSLLRGKDARTIRMKMTIILMTSTINTMNGRVWGRSPLLSGFGVAVRTTFSHQSSKRLDAWKAPTSTERITAQCNSPFTDKEVTGPRSLVSGAGPETEPSSNWCLCLLPPLLHIPLSQVWVAWEEDEISVW